MVVHIPHLPRQLVLILLICASALPVPAAPSQPTGETPQQQEQLQRRRKVLELTRKSVELFKHKKYDQVEALLNEALALDPHHATNVYNMACVKSLKGEHATAMAYLERAAEAGFTDFLHIDKDPDLEPLRKLDRYKTLLSRKNEYQKKDAQRAITALRAQFGDKYLYEIDSDAKLIFAADTDAPTLAAVKRLLTAQANSLWDQLFSHKPEQYVAIVLPSPEHYKTLIKQRGVEGIYMHQARMLIARRLGQVMMHEFTHALHAGDLDAVGQEHPIWIVEGIASLFEAARFDENSKLIPQDNYRLWYLRAAYRQQTLIPLEKLITWDQKQFVKTANLGYGTASSVMMYLYDQGLLKKFYETYKANFAQDPTGRATLEQVTGKSIRDFDLAWREWMIRRTPPAMNTGPEGVYLGVRFSQENDGLKIDVVEPNTPAAAAGLKVADIIVGMNDLDVRDQQSLMPVLKEMKPGDHVTFKVRRGDEYLQIPFTLGKRNTPLKPTTSTGGDKR